MATNQQLLRTLTGGGITKDQPLVSVFVPAAVIGGRSGRTRAQAMKLLAVGKAVARIQDVKRGRRSNPPVAMMDDVELVKVLIGTTVTPDVARQMLREAPSNSLSENKVMYGLTETQSKKLRALGEIYNRIVSQRMDNRPTLRTPEQVYNYMAPLLVHEAVEYFMVVPLDSRSKVIGQPKKITKGDVDGTDAGPRAFFRTAVRVGATSVIAVHNHPTGNAEASTADHAVTKRLVLAGKMLDIPLVDHIIVATNGFTSLRLENPSLWS